MRRSTTLIWSSRERARKASTTRSAMRRSRARSAASAAAAKSDGAASAARATGRRDGEASARVADANAAIVVVDKRETRGASSSSSRSSRPSPRARGPEAPSASSRDAFPRIWTGEAAAGAPRAPRRATPARSGVAPRARAATRVEKRASSSRRRHAECHGSDERRERRARPRAGLNFLTLSPSASTSRPSGARVPARRAARRRPRWKSAAPRARVPLEQQSLIRGRRDGNVSRGRAPRE